MPEPMPKPVDVSRMLAQAVALHRQDRLADAEQLYAAVLTVQPDHFDALHLLGVVRLSSGRPAEALELIARAMRSQTSPHALVNYGLALNLLNRYEEAVASFDRAIALNAGLADAHVNRGAALAALGRHDAAVESFGKALIIAPQHPQAHYNLSDALHRLGRHDEALDSCDLALALNPGYAQAFNLRGTILQNLKRFEEALACHEQALTLRPDDIDALNNCGSVLRALKQHDAALAAFDKALIVQPDNAEVLFNRGMVLQQLRRFAEALECYDRALAAKPNLVELHCDRGHALHALNRYDEALAACDRALALKPDHPIALNNRGVTLQAMKRYDEALAAYDQALAIYPDDAELLRNRAVTLHKLKRHAAGVASCDRAIALNRRDALAHNNRGAILYDLRRYDEALVSYQEAVAAQPDLADAYWNEAILRLTKGDFERGWPLYEWRWKKESWVRRRRNFTQPLWLGTDSIAGQTILLHSEQGFGDTIQFCRYAPAVAARGGRVILETERPLRRLLSKLDGVTEVAVRGEALPAFDWHCPLLTLPLVFGTRVETIPFGEPYLGVDPASAADWEQRLAAMRRPRIGLVWSGNPVHQSDEDRSIALTSLLPLLQSEATFVSLQKDIRPADATVLDARADIVRIDGAVTDFADTAAVVSRLDLVISVDTSVAHLAGALGKPVWILLPYVSDWRWLLDRDTSPWYPTARLFRQDDTQSWDAVIARVHDALRSALARQAI